jgi:transcription initiation factor TFIIB
MQTTISCLKCELEHLIVDVESGELVCSKCGIVAEDKMQESNVQFRAKGNEIRGTEPSSLASYDMDLSTMIGVTVKDGKGNRIQPSIQSALFRLRTWDHRIQLHKNKDRNLKRAFQLLHILKDKLNLSDVTIEKAAYIYRKALAKGMIRGRSGEVVVVASIYIALRESQSPISLREISKASNIRLNKIARIVRLVSMELDILIPLADLKRSVSKVGNTVGLSEKTKREAVDLISHIKEIEYSDGKKPMTIAATVLYLACIKTGEHVSQKEIAKAAGVTDVSIRNRVKDLKARNIVQVPPPPAL